MFGHRSFLILGGGAADILSLVKGGLEISNCSFSFQQGIDQKGKATTKVFGGAMTITMSQLPPQNIILWALQPRKYETGLIVTLNNENIPIERIIFQNAACVEFNMDYIDSSNSYASTTITIYAEKLIVGNGIPFENEWSFD